MSRLFFLSLPIALLSSGFSNSVYGDDRKREDQVLQKHIRAASHLESKAFIEYLIQHKKDIRFPSSRLSKMMTSYCENLSEHNLLNALELIEKTVKIEVKDCIITEKASLNLWASLVSIALIEWSLLDILQRLLYNTSLCRWYIGIGGFLVGIAIRVVFSASLLEEFSLKGFLQALWLLTIEFFRFISFFFYRDLYRPLMEYIETTPEVSFRACFPEVHNLFIWYLAHLSYDRFPIAVDWLTRILERGELYVYKTGKERRLIGSICRSFYDVMLTKEELNRDAFQKLFKLALSKGKEYIALPYGLLYSGIFPDFSPGFAKKKKEKVAQEEIETHVYNRYLGETDEEKGGRREKLLGADKSIYLSGFMEEIEKNLKQLKGDRKIVKFLYGQKKDEKGQETNLEKNIAVYQVILATECNIRMLAGLMIHYPFPDHLAAKALHLLKRAAEEKVSPSIAKISEKAYKEVKEIVDIAHSQKMRVYGFFLFIALVFELVSWCLPKYAVDWLYTNEISLD